MTIRLPDFLRGPLLGALPALAAALCTAPAQAGRPLTVDDANTNDRGAGHVEVWVAREAGTTVVNLAPAYAPFDGLEFAATLSRNTTDRVNASALQAKWRVTPSQERGCNLGTSFGVAHEGGGGGNARFVNGLVSCNAGDLGSAHLNLGLVKASGVASVRTWGVAFERAYGPVTPHVEFFGERGSKPVVQLGARTEVADSVQLDGTVGRSDGRTLYSLGFKIGF